MAEETIKGSIGLRVDRFAIKVDSEIHVSGLNEILAYAYSPWRSPAQWIVYRVHDKKQLACGTILEWNTYTTDHECYALKLEILKTVLENFNIIPL